jgi:hypothetical protein
MQDSIALSFRTFGLAFFQGTPREVGLGAGLNDIRPVSDAVDQRLAQPGVGNQCGLFRGRQIGGDDRHHVPSRWNPHYRRSGVMVAIECRDSIS